MEKLDKKRTIKDLEILASEVLKLKQERAKRRPLLIEFCGSPKSGKSTTINSLNIFLKRNGFNTVVLVERASVCPIENKRHPFFNIWTLTSAISEIVKYLEREKDRVDIIISDRGIFDALCWFEWLNKNPNSKSPHLDDDSHKQIENFILMDMWCNYLDLIYVLQVNPATSIKREYANLLTEKRGSIMTEKVLKGFNLATESVIERHSAKFRNIQKIVTDTSETDNDPNTVSYTVTLEILKSLRDLLIEKVGFVDNSFKKKLSHGINNIHLLDNERLDFENRDIVETRDVLQPIAIAVITNPQRNNVLVVKKSGKRISKQSPEKEKLLLYIGGHVRLEDNKSGILKTIEQTLHREIEEEIGESLSIQKEVLESVSLQNNVVDSVSIKNTESFIIYTPNLPVSRKHFAVCYVIEMDLDDKKFKLVSDEFTMKTGTSRSGHILQVNEIISGKHKLESWSRLILEEVFKRRIPDTIEIFDEQLS
ncbi:hypothetical protein DYU11_17700 [Fibrisoma montanum]|uniref:Nudix hydrolase domain-containing protein n=1 Tax=Fibrisoma montanum TaxID=2305895 RepID=A0A418M5X3_9BACT|nr:NUDIX hydrolase [Fibrisoma montanum]RIV21254.1 hypothetical protein DYU11_17700 [Fibrisoma montanum]